jgi:hypothetical protein
VAGLTTCRVVGFPLAKTIALAFVSHILLLILLSSVVTERRILIPEPAKNPTCP